MPPIHPPDPPCDSAGGEPPPAPTSRFRKANTLPSRINPSTNASQKRCLQTLSCEASLNGQ
jgi:hypothetical protein